MAAQAKVNMAYFPNWGIYSTYNFQPTDVNPGPLSHILYAFADISPDTGVISLTDLYADQQKLFPGDNSKEPGNNLYGCLKQFYKMKLANRNLKITLSVGGGTNSSNGHFNFVTDATKRATFVSSALQLIEDNGLDGLDLDYEYPSTTAQGQGFADLVTSLRSALDSYAASKGDSVPYVITAAVSAKAYAQKYLNVPQMDKALSFWNIMAYDYSGSWTSYVDNQANLYGGAKSGVSTDKAVQWFLTNGATASKIVIGIPEYGRSFEKTAGIGQPYNGVGPGTYPYNTLPLAGAQVTENLTDVASYSYDATKREFVSYDTAHIVSLKAQYVISKSIGGNMHWHLAMDKKGSDSLVSTTAGVFGTVDQTQNHISYPNSKWDNIRNNLGSSDSGDGDIEAKDLTGAATNPTHDTNDTPDPFVRMSDVAESQGDMG
ncbi:glycoside hydrolase family 18 protein [Irpex lacteus]|nr:glycoside hydrolase family 18 protein [Irpex lacteus]